MELFEFEKNIQLMSLAKFPTVAEIFIRFTKNQSHIL